MGMVVSFNAPPKIGRATHVFADCLQLVCVYILPYPLHVLPVCDNAVLQRVVDLEEAPILLCLRADENITLERARHCPYVFRPANKRGKVAFRRVLPCKARANGAAAIIEHDGRIVESGAHCGGLDRLLLRVKRSCTGNRA